MRSRTGDDLFRRVASAEVVYGFVTGERRVVVRRPPRDLSQTRASLPRRSRADQRGGHPSCSGSPPGAWSAWSTHLGSPGSRVPRSARRSPTSIPRPRRFVLAHSTPARTSSLPRRPWCSGSARRPGGGVHALIATGVNADRHREPLGFHVSSAEDGAVWLAFFRDPVARGWPGARWSPVTPALTWSRRFGQCFPARAGNGHPSTSRTAGVGLCDGGQI